MRRWRLMVRGALTVGRRRGVGYFGYLVRGVIVPRLAYRVCWGPRAPRLGRRLFERWARISGEAPPAGELQRLGLLAQGSADPAVSVEWDEVERLMERAHREGVTGVAASFDRAVRADGDVRFAELPGARRHRWGSAPYLAGRDADRKAFSRMFGIDLMTEDRARQRIHALKSRLPDAYRDYAPIDFGYGLAVGQIASTDSGTGRWDFCNGEVVGPLVKGGRVLDLGCNNGSQSLMMLRAGAREVVGVEGSPEIAEIARLNAHVFAWRDMRPYDLTVLTGDMRLFLQQDLGRFDVVTAFCSLYYLARHDMAAIVRKTARMGATLVLQANEAIGSGLPGTTRDLRRLMVENGYPRAEVYAPPGFSRPLLVGGSRRPTSARLA